VPLKLKKIDNSHLTAHGHTTCRFDQSRSK